MRRIRFGVAAGAFALASVVPAAMAQELNEVCPDSPDGTGALWGMVSDEDGEMGLPGASVVVTWDADGDEGRTEGQTGFDGGYVLCYVPLEAELSVHPTFGNADGSPTMVSLTDPITRMDLVFSLTGAGGGDEDDDRIWACVGGVDNRINMENARYIRCDPGWEGINRCPVAEQHGQVQATMAGAGSGRSALREALEKIIADARRQGANSLINWRITRNSLSAEAVTITVDPVTCR